MYLTFFLTLLLSVTVFAQSLQSNVNTRCYTRYSSRATSVIRKTNFRYATTRTAYAYQTNTPRATVTPAVVTSAVTTTSTSTARVTAATSTDTFTRFTTTTQTDTSTTTNFLTQWLTSTSTSTVATSTTTIAPPVGFTNLAESTGYAAKRNAVVEKFEAMEERAAPVKGYLPIIDEASPLHARQAQNAAEFPVAISCTASTTFTRTSTFIRTAATATTTIKAKTIFTTVTVPASTTLTIIPARVTELATVTGHAQTLITTLQEVTSTSTSTQTVNVPAATFLAQCAPKNLVASAVGQKIGTISFNPAFTLQSLYVTEHPVYGRGYSCCVQCANDKNCAGFAQQPDSGTQQGACYYITTDGRCDVGQSFGDRAHYYNTNGNGYIVGNAQCGFLGFAAGRPKVST
ncbi:hypothetical protein TI39_contig695g00007 [Zymoseptoria brevis]|uniref:Apple domain-containing protein n=1 Tax=Zymoseptoria brevis TaxID=1047168 RepID=A0A0F4GFK1_9PEZI|nr:hypothetical protein TI39_contig695g00007 [Zymoseptoria brevis]